MIGLDNLRDEIMEMEALGFYNGFENGRWIYLCSSFASLGFSIVISQSFM